MTFKAALKEKKKRTTRENGRGTSLVMKHSQGRFSRRSYIQVTSGRLEEVCLVKRTRVDVSASQAEGIL